MNGVKVVIVDGIKMSMDGIKVVIVNGIKVVLLRNCAGSTSSQCDYRATILQ